MKIRCEYCGQYIQDTDAVCPNCGAPNDRLQRSGSGVPKTIEELKSFAAAHNLPLEKMRFFLGEDYRGARAFGIYEDGDGCFVVYKNKADGSRAVRYRGKDEAYAVNEIYQKMKSEIANQRSRRAADSGSSGGRSARSGRRSWRSNPMIIVVLIILVVNIASNVVGIINRRHRPQAGYYNYNNSYYYYQDNDWYLYDSDAYYWIPVTVDDTLAENYNDYYTSDSYYDSYGVDNFADSGYYKEPSDWDNDWDDSDWDWSSSDDWDSSYSDWDSDW